MTIRIQKYARKPFFVDAVQVTEENMADVADWTSGTIMDFDETAKVKTAKFIQVKVHNATSPRLTRAFVGDYVLQSGKGFKIYLHSAFERTFESVFQPREVGTEMPREDTVNAAIKKPWETVVNAPKATETPREEDVQKFQESIVATQPTTVVGHMTSDDGKLHVVSEEEVAPGVVATRIEEVAVISEASAPIELPEDQGELVEDPLVGGSLPSEVNRGLADDLCQGCGVQRQKHGEFAEATGQTPDNDHSFVEA